MSNFTVGLTGGIGSGKTAVSDRFQALGVTIVDADVASRVVVEPGRPALAEIVDHFGEDVLQEDGTLNRALLRSRVFAESSERVWLQHLLHPLINQEIEKGLRESSSRYAMLVSPLLIEAGQSRYTDRVLVVDVSVEIQIQRTMTRDDNSEEQVRAIVAAQTSREKRLETADDVLTNDGDLATLYAAIDSLHSKYIELAGDKA